MGCIYQINTDGTGYIKLVDFDGSNGSGGQGLNIFNNILYGATYYGVTNNKGVLFKITLPSLQATNINFPSIEPTQAIISWTNGNGDQRAVFVKEGTGLISLPQDNTFYTASNDWYNKGTQLDNSGYYCVYNGTGNAVTLTNLSPGQYTVQVFEYTGNGNAQHYLTTTAAGNPITMAYGLAIANVMLKKDGLVEIKTSQDVAFDVMLNPNPNNGTFNISIAGKSGLYRV